MTSPGSHEHAVLFVSLLRCCADGEGHVPGRRCWCLLSGLALRILEGDPWRSHCVLQLRNHEDLFVPVA